MRDFYFFAILPNKLRAPSIRRFLANGRETSKLHGPDYRVSRFQL